MSTAASPSNPGNLPLALVGAVLGAALGVAGWLALEHYADYAFGPPYFALFPGGFAGLLAVLLGKRPAGSAFAATAIALIAVLAGGYLSCWNAASMAREQSHDQAVETVAGYENLDAEQRALVDDKVHAGREETEAITPMSRLMSSWGLWFLLFTILSVWMAHFIMTGGSFPLVEGPPTGQP